MDKLRSIFEKEQLNLADLPDGHTTRFRKKLEKEFPTKSSFKRRVIPIISYAAAASIGIIVFFSVIKTSAENTIANEKIILVTENAEAVEAEVYLQGEVSTRMKAISQLDKKKKHTANLMHDIEDFDSSLSKLSSDLEEAPGDQRIVDAVLNTYIMKIEALDNIVNILQKIS